MKRGDEMVSVWVDEQGFFQYKSGELTIGYNIKTKYAVINLMIPPEDVVRFYGLGDITEIDFCKQK